MDDLEIFFGCTMGPPASASSQGGAGVLDVSTRQVTALKSKSTPVNAVSMLVTDVCDQKETNAQKETSAGKPLGYTVITSLAIPVVIACWLVL